MKPVMAFTLAEMAVGVGLFAIVLGLLLAINRGASRAGARTVEHSQALRAAMSALEVIQRDVDRMLYQCVERDLVMVPHPELGPGRGLSLMIPSISGAPDPWKARHVPILFALRKVPGPKPAYNLVRTETGTGRETVYRAALLADLKFGWMPRRANGAPGLSPYHDYLSVTVTGLGSAMAEVRFVSSLLLPLPRMGAPEDYPVLGGD